MLQEILRGRREGAARVATAEAARSQREYEHNEARYIERRDAYIDLEQIILKRERASLNRELQGDPSPAELGEGFIQLSDVDDALARVQLLGSDSASAAAEELARALYTVVFEGKDFDVLDDQKKPYRAEVRADLNRVA